MSLDERFEIPPIDQRSADLTRRLIVSRATRLHAPELLPHVVPAPRRASPRFVEQRSGQHGREERVGEDVVLRRAHHAKRRNHVGDDRIVGQRFAEGEAAGNSRVEKRRLEHLPDFVRAVEQGDVAPIVSERLPIARQVRHQPRGLLVVVVERSDVDREGRQAIGLRLDSLHDGRRVERDEAASQLEDVARTAVILLEADRRRQLEVIEESLEHLGVGAGPRVDRLLVVADGEHVAVILRQRLHDPVLHWIQVLEFVDENDVPSRADRRTLGVPLQQLGGLDDQRVEVDDLARREKPLVAREQHGVVVQQRVAAESVRRESVERLGVPAAVAFDAPQHAQLILFVGDAEPRFEQHARAELAQQFGAERVDRSAFDVRRRRAERGCETLRDLAGGLVRERECANARRIDVQFLDEMANALDEAVRLARAGPGENEERSRRRPDGRDLRCRRRARWWRETLAVDGRRHAALTTTDRRARSVPSWRACARGG